MNIIIDVGAPLLLHMVVSELTALFMGPGSDSALRTAVTSVIVIPAALWMVNKDRESGKRQMGAKKAEGKEKATRDNKMETGRRVFLILLCLLAGAALNFLWSGALNAMGIQEHFSNAAQEKLLAGQAAVQLVSLGFLVPVAEELVFRVLIYGRMRRLFGIGMSVVFSSLLFAVYHGNPIQMIFAFPMAAVLALIYEKGKWAGYPIAFHMGANLAAVLANIL